jgi:hypothetical protein
VNLQKTPHLHQSPYPSLHLATTAQALPPISLPSLTSLVLPEVMLPCTFSLSGTPSTSTSPHSSHLSDTLLKPSMPTPTLTSYLYHSLEAQFSTTTLLPIPSPLATESTLEHSHDMEEFNRLPGLIEIISDVRKIDVVLNTLSTTYK